MNHITSSDMCDHVHIIFALLFIIGRVTNNPVFMSCPGCFFYKVMEVSWFLKNCSEDQISSTAKYRWANKKDEEEKRDKWGKKN